MRPKEVSDKLQLEKIAKDHVWKVEPSCATTGEGIFEGLVRAHPALVNEISALHKTTNSNSAGMAFQQRENAAYQIKKGQNQLLDSLTLYDCTRISPVLLVPLSLCLLLYLLSAFFFCFLFLHVLCIYPA
jgi:hypothetical protein